MKILLTGHRGFVGRHLQRALEGHDVLGIDLLDGIDCLDFFRKDRTRFDLAIHCAATVGGRTSIDGSPLAVATNLALDSLYFRWLIASKTLRAVYFSSSAAYPIDLQTAVSPAYRLSEVDIDPDFTVTLEPDATYGLAKRTGEQLAKYATREGVSVLIPRPFSGYGEDQALDYPFPSFIQRAARREDPFTIWGDGTQVRDFIHIDDVVGAVLAALDGGIEGPVNLGTGIGTSFNELAATVCSAVGYSPEFTHIKTAPTGVHHRVCDPSLMYEFYIPTVPLETGIKRALNAIPEEVA